MYYLMHCLISWAGKGIQNNLEKKKKQTEVTDLIRSFKTGKNPKYNVGQPGDQRQY